MDRVKTVNDLLRAKGVTPEEEEKLREIIEECRMREAQIKEASDTAREHMERLSDALAMVFDTFVIVGKSVDALHDEVESLQLRMMPEKEFYME